MENWQYIVGVQLDRPKGLLEVPPEGREIIESHTPPEVWLNRKGSEGWELVVAIHRGDYTEFFIKRRSGKAKSKDVDPTAQLERQAIPLARQAEDHFSRNEFDEVLSKLKELQRIVSKHE